MGPLAYLPTSRTVTIATTSLGPDSVCAWWFRPEDGTTTFGGDFRGGSSVFTPPSASDWVLVVDKKSLGFSAPGEAPIPTGVERPPAGVLNLAITPNPLRGTGRVILELAYDTSVRV